MFKKISDEDFSGIPPFSFAPQFFGLAMPLSRFTFTLILTEFTFYKLKPSLQKTSTSTSILSRTEYRYNAQSARNNKLINKKCWKMPLINDHSSDQIKKGLEI